MKYKPLTEEDFSFLLTAADNEGIRKGMVMAKIASRCAALGIAPETKMLRDTGYETRKKRKLKVS